jgi:tRNA modification GTPase
VSSANSIAGKLLKGSGGTIAAISTPAGVGGIGIVRMSGPDSLSIGLKAFRASNHSLSRQTIKPRRMYHGYIQDPTGGGALDEVLLVYFRPPNSYTTQEMVEIHCHGGSYASSRIMEMLLKLGCRQAHPGEFSYQALLGGRLDLSQVEAVANLIEARSETEGRIALEALKGNTRFEVETIRARILEIAAQLEVGIDFPEDQEDFDSAAVSAVLHEIIQQIRLLIDNYQAKRAYLEGANVVIFGRPNVGKSSLFNRLLGRKRAIVSQIAGTTRDCLHQELIIKGVTCRLIDSAGFDDQQDELSVLARGQALEFLNAADLALLVMDSSQPLQQADRDLLKLTQGKNRLLVFNKTDLAPGLDEHEAIINSSNPCPVSALTGAGFAELEGAIKLALCGPEPEPQPGEILVNQRQSLELGNCMAKLQSAHSHLASPDGGVELASLDIQQALEDLDKVDGASSVEQVIETVFNRFCVGK